MRNISSNSFIIQGSEHFFTSDNWVSVLSFCFSLKTMLLLGRHESDFQSLLLERRAAE